MLDKGEGLIAVSESSKHCPEDLCRSINDCSRVRNIVYGRWQVSELLLTCAMNVVADSRIWDGACHHASHLLYMRHLGSPMVLYQVPDAGCKLLYY